MEDDAAIDPDFLPVVASRLWFSGQFHLGLTSEASAWRRVATV